MTDATTPTEIPADPHSAGYGCDVEELPEWLTDHSTYREVTVDGQRWMLGFGIMLALRGEARELRILGSVLEDSGGDAGRAYAIAGEVRLTAPSLDDLLGYEVWCREVAADADLETRPTEPTPPFCPSCGAPLTHDRLDGSTAYYCACPGYGAGAPTPPGESCVGCERPTFAAQLTAVGDALAGATEPGEVAGG